MGVEDHAEFIHGENLWKGLSPVLIICGTLGNLLTIAVLTRSRSRYSSTAIYLTSLAVADLFVLYTGLLRQWINYTFEVDIRKLSAPGCKIHLFLVYLGTQVSSWILVAVTTERFIGVWCPHKVKMGCTPRIAGVVVAVIVGCLACLNIHWFVGFGKVTAVSGNMTVVRQCTALYDDYRLFMRHAWPWIDLCVFALVPFIIIVSANLAIIYKVVSSSHKNRTKVAPAARGTKKRAKNSQLTAMLLSVNTVFCICVFPISIYLIGQKEWVKQLETTKDVAVMTLWWAVVNIFMYTNHTLNFVLYFLSGTRFRREVKVLFCGGKANSLFTIGGATTAAAPRNGATTHTVSVVSNGKLGDRQDSMETVA